MDSRGMPCARARGAWGVPFEGTQAIVSLQLLTCLRRFQVILKYCRTTQARYFDDLIARAVAADDEQIA
jgi:hypothetical protein